MKAQHSVALAIDQQHYKKIGGKYLTHKVNVTLTTIDKATDHRTISADMIQVKAGNFQARAGAKYS